MYLEWLDGPYDWRLLWRIFHVTNGRLKTRKNVNLSLRFKINFASIIITACYPLKFPGYFETDFKLIATGRRVVMKFHAPYGLLV